MGLSVQEKKHKIDSQDGGHSDHLGFPIGMIWAIFDLRVIPMLPTKFQVLIPMDFYWPSIQEKKFKIAFRDGNCGSHLVFSTGIILTIFDLQVTPMLPTKFGVSWLSVQEKKGKISFWRWQPWWPSWISNLNDFSYFWSISLPDASYHVLSQLAFWFRRRRAK